MSKYGRIPTFSHTCTHTMYMYERERERERERAVPMQYGINYYNKIHQESFSE